MDLLVKEKMQNDLFVITLKKACMELKQRYPKHQELQATLFFLKSIEE